MDKTFGQHISYLKSVGDHALPKREDFIATTQIEITSGRHSGSISTFEQEGLSIGGTEDCDVLLLDKGLEDVSAQLTFSWSAFGILVECNAHGASIVMNGSKVEDGTSQTARLPCVIEIDDVSIRVCRSSEDRMPQIFVRAAIICVALLGIASLAGAIILAQTKSTQVVVSNDAPAEQTTPQPSVSALELVEAQLLDAKLSTHLNVVELPNRVISLTGNLPEDRAADWRDVRAKIDAELGSRILITDIAVVSSKPRIPAIAHIRLGNAPLLAFASGDTAGIGDRLDNGWMITEISATTFTISREDELLTLTYR